MSRRFASKADVLRERFEAKDSIQLHVVDTTHRDEKDTQEVGDMVFNTDHDEINVLKSTGWNKIVTVDEATASIENNGIVFGNSTGSISTDAGSLFYDDSIQSAAIATTSFAAINATESAIIGGTNQAITGLSTQSAIVGGNSNTIDNVDEAVAIGSGNTIQGGENNFAIGSNNNLTSVCQNSFSIGTAVSHAGSDKSIGIGDTLTFGGTNNSTTIGRNISCNHDNIIAFNNSGSTVTTAKNDDFLINVVGFLGINTNDPKTTFDVNGGLRGKYRGVQGTYNTARDDLIIGARTNTGPVTVTFSADDLVAGRIILVVDTDGNASANNITLNGSTFSGLASLTINQDYGGLLLLANGSMWLKFKILI